MLDTPTENDKSADGGDRGSALKALALRRLAVEIAQTRAEPSLVDLKNMQPEAMRQALHELQVHQIELEMQNEELRRTQLALETAHARYFDLYDLAPVGYCTVTAQGLVLEANIAAATLLGSSRSELVGQRVSRFIVKTDQDSFYLQRKRLLDTATIQTIELQMQTAAGAPFWAQLTATLAPPASPIAPFASLALPMADAPNIRLLLSDIGARRQAEAALRESEQRYRNLFNSMDEGYCIIELIYDAYGKPVDFKYLEVNPAFEKQSGLPGAAGKRILELVPYLDSSWFEIYGNVQRTGEPIRIKNESKILERWFDIYAFRIGEPGHFKVAVLFTDVTLSRVVDDERQQLSNVVHEKNATLELAIAVADSANHAKSDFLSSMSHELRTPLSAILGFAQLLDSGQTPLNTSQKRSVDHILQSGWYLLDLISEILDLALVESGKLTLATEPISLLEVMSECAAMVESQAKTHDVAVSFPKLEQPGELHWILADRIRLKQVLINLLSNAIKYNRAGGTVEVSCKVLGPKSIRICVIDSGEGLTPEQLSQLFQPFNRLGREGGAEQGTGIGLVVCKRLVELMGGNIEVESTPGKGSVFWIELLLTDEPPASQPATPEHGLDAAAALPIARQHTLLYVEDNPANLMLVEDLIARKPSVRLISAADGTRGVEMALLAQPDVILMDINLPGISGIKALELLSLNPLTQHIPVVALSANAMQHDINKGLAAGFFRYLTKPIKITEFMTTLDLALATAEARKASSLVFTPTQPPNRPPTAGTTSRGTHDD